MVLLTALSSISAVNGSSTTRNWGEGQ